MYPFLEMFISWKNEYTVENNKQWKTNNRQNNGQGYTQGKVFTQATEYVVVKISYNVNKMTDL